MAHTFEREALYEEVWSAPLTKLGLKYGLSDNGLRKICIALSIPLPPAGHWAKVAAGHGVFRPPLPKHEGADTFESRAEARQQRRSEYASDEDAAWLEQRLQFESTPEGAVVVPQEVTRWHRAIAPFRAKLIEGAHQHADEIKERDRYRAARARQARPGPDMGALRWRHLDQGLLFDPNGGRACFRVSIQTFRRALAIANALATAATKRGFRVEGDADEERLAFSLEGQAFSVAVRERPQRSSAPGAAAGKLALVTSGYGMGEWEIVDDAAPLEEQLGRVFPRWYRAVVRGRELEREEAAREERSAQYRAEAEAAVEQRAAQEAMAQVAAERQAKLLQEAARWHQVAQLRGYVGAVASVGLAGNDWQHWALTVADKLDPLLDASSSFRNP